MRPRRRRCDHGPALGHQGDGQPCADRQGAGPVQRRLGQDRAEDRRMTDPLDDAIRARLLADPALILSDRDLMRALVAAREAELGENVIDIRGRAMEALEHRLDRLESAHESVISAAYENQAGTQTIHRAVLSLLESVDFASFLVALEPDVAPVLRVATLQLVMESAESARVAGDGGPLVVVPAGSVGRIIAAGRKAPRGDDIVLRRASAE